MRGLTGSKGQRFLDGPSFKAFQSVPKKTLSSWCHLLPGHLLAPCPAKFSTWCWADAFIPGQQYWSRQTHSGTPRPSWPSQIILQTPWAIGLAREGPGGPQDLRMKLCCSRWRRRRRRRRRMCWPSFFRYCPKAALIGSPSMETPPARSLSAGCFASSLQWIIMPFLFRKVLLLTNSIQRRERW